MADKLSTQQLDNLIAEAVDEILEDKDMDTKKFEDSAVSKLVNTARSLQALARDYPGTQSMQQRAIDIKQAYRLQVPNLKPSRAGKQSIFSSIWRPRVTFSAVSALAVVLAIVTVALQGTGGGVTATAIGGTWVLPALVGTLIAIAGIAYWFSKK